MTRDPELLSLDPDQPLTISGRLVAVPGSPDSVANASLDLPLSVNDEGRKVLALFSGTATPREAAAAAGLDAEEQPIFFEMVEELHRAAALVPPDEDRFLRERGRALRSAGQKLFTPPSLGIFAAHPAGTAPGPADFRFVGVPFDLASTRTGSAAGPMALRTMSNMLPCHRAPETGRCLGLLDLADGETKLAGALLEDHGDAVLRHCYSLREVFDAIAEVARHVIDRPGVPVFVGGDHSITGPIVRELAAQTPLFVVHLDAHNDLADHFEGDPHHHGNVMEALRRHPGVEGLLQLGVRGVTAPWWTPPDGVRIIGADQLDSLEPDRVLEQVPEELPCYVTLDIDVLDPAYAPATGTPVPGGLSLARAVKLLAALGTARDVVGIDVVEFAPEHGNEVITHSSVARMLLALLDVVHRRRSIDNP